LYRRCGWISDSPAPCKTQALDCILPVCCDSFTAYSLLSTISSVPAHPLKMTLKSNLISAFAPLANLASYHLLMYSTLLGTELYQVSFLCGTRSQADDTESCVTLPEFCYDQSVLQRTTHLRLYDPAKARLSSILSYSVNPHSSDGSHTSSLRTLLSSHLYR